MNNLFEQLSIITGVPQDTIEKLIKKSYLCISDDLYGAKINGETCVDIDIIFGTLTLKIQGDDLKIKFNPSEELIKTIKTTLLENKSILKTKIEKSLIDNITKTFNELI